jgi:hypothetical protein
MVAVPEIGSFGMKIGRAKWVDGLNAGIRDSANSAKV